MLDPWILMIHPYNQDQFLLKFHAGFLSHAQCATWWRPTLTFQQYLDVRSLNSSQLLPQMSLNGKSWWSSAQQRVKKSCTSTATGLGAQRWR